MKEKHEKLQETRKSKKTKNKQKKNLEQINWKKIILVLSWGHYWIEWVDTNIQLI